MKRYTVLSRMLSVLLCILMVASLLPVSVFAEGVEAEAVEQTELVGQNETAPVAAEPEVEDAENATYEALAEEPVTEQPAAAPVEEPPVAVVADVQTFAADGVAAIAAGDGETMLPNSPYYQLFGIDGFDGIKIQYEKAVFVGRSCVFEITLPDGTTSSCKAQHMKPLAGGDWAHLSMDSGRYWLYTASEDGIRIASGDRKDNDCTVKYSWPANWNSNAVKLTAYPLEVYNNSEYCTVKMRAAWTEKPQLPADRLTHIMLDGVQVAETTCKFPTRYKFDKSNIDVSNVNPGYTHVGTDIETDAENNEHYFVYLETKEFTVTYKLDDQDNACETQSYKFGENIIAADAPEAPVGYKFSGWENLPETMPAEDITVTGSFVPDEEQTKDLTYSVEYYKNDVIADTDTVTESVQVLQPDTLAVDMSAINTVDKYPGYTFDEEATGTIPETVNTDDVIKVYYTANTDTAYNVEHYLELLDGSYELDSTELFTGITDTLTNAVANSYAGFTAKDVNQQTINCYGTTSVAVYYDRNIHTVSYVITGVQPITDVACVPDAVSVKYGAAVEIAAPAAADGYIFSGWSASEGFAMPDNDVQITGSFAPRADLSYTVNYLNAADGAAIAASKTVDGQIFDTQVTESPVMVIGFNAPAAQTITIGLEDNVINFYYNVIQIAPAAPAAPETPDNRPAAPVNAPVIPAAPVTAIAAIPAMQNIKDEETPLAGPAVTVDDPMEIDDEATPLAAAPHEICILHFVILCAALIILLLYINELRKHHQKMSEMRG